MKDKLLKSQRALFEIPPDVTYLNCANMAPQLHSVAAAGAAAIKTMAKPWKITPPEWFSGAERLRSLAAKVMGAEPEGVALVPSVSYGIAAAAANVEVAQGQSIVLLENEFPSNVYAWRELARKRSARIRPIRREEHESWTSAVLEAIDDDTAVVAVSNCHWTDGSLVDLVKVGAKARSVGAALVVDASQSLGAYPFDVKQVQPHFAVSVGYKWLLGPYGLGYMYVAPRWRKEGVPLENSWLSRADAEDFAGLVNYRDEYRPGARRFDFGEFPSFILLPMAIAALTQILDWGVEAIQNTLSSLTDMIEEKAGSLNCEVVSAANRVGHLIGISPPGGITERVTSSLSEAKIYVSIRGDRVRIAPHLYNDESDIERFFSVFKESLSN
jgi:selenocysteine lyase/cysteine desulfurase